MSDYYSTLGVNRSASADEIKQAYRRMAGKHHPDRGGDKAKFQEIEEAYRTLSDEGKRAAYDNPNPFPHGMHNSGFPGGFSFSFGSNGFNFNDMFEMFGQRGGPNQEFQRRTMRLSLWIRLYDVVVGGKRPVAIATTNGTTTVEIDIPTGINDGDNVRYAGLAPNGHDLIIQFRIHPEPTWQRQDLDLISEVSVSVWDLILGADITVTDITGVKLTATIPPRTQPKSMLRLRGKGIRDNQGRIGDILLRVDASIPDKIDPALISAIEKHRK